MSVFRFSETLEVKPDVIVCPFVPNCPVIGLLFIRIWVNCILSKGFFYLYLVSNKVYDALVKLLKTFDNSVGLKRWINSRWKYLGGLKFGILAMVHSCTVNVDLCSWLTYSLRGLAPPDQNSDWFKDYPNHVCTLSKCLKCSPLSLAVHFLTVFPLFFWVGRNCRECRCTTLYVKLCYVFFLHVIGANLAKSSFSIHVMALRHPCNKSIFY